MKFVFTASSDKLVKVWRLTDTYGLKGNELLGLICTNTRFAYCYIRYYCAQYITSAYPLEDCMSGWIMLNFTSITKLSLASQIRSVCDGAIICYYINHSVPLFSLMKRDLGFDIIRCHQRLFFK